MKTFLLKGLQIIESQNEEIVKTDINLLDGLIINREDDNNTWLIEALVDKNYLDFFKVIQEKEEQVMIEVKISKTTNAPATFITSIDSINNIGKHINVMLMGKIIDKRKSKIEEMLSELIEKGYEGEILLTKFKSLL
ncbi:YwpF family protein [Paucisalibacillus globulus]|uniref:YwpF family protein n=1 Tax=Paucisalibacillus globulus TaxID=351095 RepID=UPI000423C374|nr:YwpF family protein [Paucisalibacillus globulus]